MAHARTYIETFENGPGGWMHCVGNGDDGVQRLQIEDGAAVSRSPWWIDYNHAPPGAGYLHLLFALHTQHGPNFPVHFEEVGGPNRFIEGGFSTNFTNAQVTLRLRGELEQRGSQVVFLAQAKVGNHTIGHLLVGQPFMVTPQWSEQTVTLTPEAQQWKCLGSRHDRNETYGWGEVGDVLRDLNVDILLVLHPLDVVPLPTLEGDMHRLKAGEEYSVDRSRLPQGYVMLDEVRIQFAQNE